MSTHLLVISHDERIPGPVHPDQHIYPEHPEERDYRIVCLNPKQCIGWSTCPEPHEVDGRSAACGPHSCDCPDGQPGCLGDEPDEGDRPRPPWFDEETFTFHGIEHTWRHGWDGQSPTVGASSPASMPNGPTRSTSHRSAPGRSARTGPTSPTATSASRHGLRRRRIHLQELAHRDRLPINDTDTEPARTGRTGHRERTPADALLALPVDGRKPPRSRMRRRTTHRAAAPAHRP